jgi:hypothetical protein
MKPTSIINLRKYIRWLTFSSLGPVSPVDLTTEYEARWGTVVAGKAVGWYAIITDVNGSHAFPPLYFRCLTTA